MALESKLLVGRYIDSPRSHCSKPDGTKASPFGGNLFICQPSNIDSIKESTAQSWKHPFTRESVIENLTRTQTNKQHRNFHWLYWYPGYVNYLSREVDVLSGPFSGCWLIVFRYQGVEYVAHIGTEADDTKKNIAVKTAWDTFAATLTGNDCILGGFNPSQAAQAEKERVQNAITECWGLVTRDNKFYSVVVINDGTSAKIEHIISVSSTSIDDLCKLSLIKDLISSFRSG